MTGTKATSLIREKTEESFKTTFKDCIDGKLKTKAACSIDAQTAYENLGGNAKDLVSIKEKAISFTLQGKLNNCSKTAKATKQTMKAELKKC